MFIWTPLCPWPRAAAPLPRASVARAAASDVSARRRGPNRSLLPVSIIRAPVPVLEPDDVVEERCGHLEQQRVLERHQAMENPGPDMEAHPRLDDLRPELVLVLADLEAGAAAVHVDRLVLAPLELKAQRFARADEQELPAVLRSHGVDVLVAP